jgi:hypothetical protein
MLKCFKLKKKTLILWSFGEEDDDAPIEVFGKDKTYEELRGLIKITLFQHSTSKALELKIVYLS